MATIQELRALALQIRDADEPAENTALKVGQFLYDLLGYLDTKADLTMKGQWSKQLNFNQAPIVALQSAEAIPDSQGQNNKMWWSSDDGQLKWKANDEVYPLGNPTYILYYCGNKIYRWSGSTTGFVDMTHAVINDLTTGGEGDALSAEMGKILRINLMRIFNALGAYAFPDGKPILDWYSTVIKHDIRASLNDFTVSAIFVDGASVNELPEQIIDGQSLSLTIAPSDSDYDINESSLVITMDGIDKKSTSYNSSTGEISFDSVTGSIVIEAAVKIRIDSLGYAKTENLVFMLDGIHQGDNPGAWTDLVRDVKFANHGATKIANGWQFDGTNWLEASAMPERDILNCTIEVVYDSSKTANTVYHVFTDGKKMVLNYTPNYQGRACFIARGYQSPGTPGALDMGQNGDNGQGKRIVSIKGATVGQVGGRVNGVEKPSYAINYGAGAKPIVGGLWDGTNSVFSGILCFIGKVYAIRIYNTFLTDAEILANQQIDNERFELGLTLPTT